MKIFLGSAWICDCNFFSVGIFGGVLSLEGSALYVVFLSITNSIVWMFLGNLLQFNNGLAAQKLRLCDNLSRIISKRNWRDTVLFGISSSIVSSV